MSTEIITKPFPVAGVVFAWAMPILGDGYEIPLFEISEALENPNISIWLHLNLSNSQIQRWLENTPLIPERVVEMIQEGVNLSRLERIEKLDDCLLMVMNDFQQEFGEGAGDSSLGTLWAIVRPKLMVSLRNNPLRTTDKLRYDLRNGQLNPGSVIELFHELLDLRAEQLRTLLVHLSGNMDDLEENLLKGREFPEHENLGRIRIQCSRLRRHFSPELIALHRLLKRLPYWFTEEDKNSLNDDLDLLSYLVQEISSLYDRAKVLQDEQAAHVAEFNAKNLQVLSVMTVIFLPMTLITGVMGMNMEDLPGLKGSFYQVMFLMSITGAAVFASLKLKRII
ncbi:CorA family divalent cation transporter [Polynucleobacter sp. JS-Polo-80-F4]|uniref:CorA family divalent cation transporter n=1 Tax=Polynucleobacter sp. JS-Polo-80-F4 TaxID=2576918 RepID=UPI001C0C77AC|nr:CorA family divalent cation transporter [Polynucleobacter sp. JS-Polo-80-F4]MBU3615732.1 magnesium transporter CorA [Polynucleobacter sp. JS-Polo-80-F4]